MARINIEDSLFKDTRFYDLVAELKSKTTALGALTEAWIVAQEFWKKNSHGIPKPQWVKQRLNNALITVGFAVDRGDFIYMCGSEEQFTWLRQRVDAGRKGGLAGKNYNHGNHSEISEATAERPLHPAKPLSLTPPLSLSQNTKTKKEPSGGQGQQPALPTLSPSQEFVAAYVRAFQGRHGPKTQPDLSGKVQGGIKRLLATVPLDRACAMIQVYMQLDDPWFKTKAWDFATFEANLTKVGLALDTGRDPSETRHKGIGELLAEEEAENERRLT